MSDPKLDPCPWRQGNGSNHAIGEGCFDKNGVLTPHQFAPRIGAGYSGDPADYDVPGRDRISADMFRRAGNRLRARAEQIGETRG